MQLPSQWLINIVKVLPFRLQQCFDKFAMLSVKGCSQTRLFRHLSNHLFRSRYFGKYISYEGHLLLANVLNWIQILEMQEKNSEIVLCFSYNCIWIGCVKLSLLSRWCLSSTVNVLANSLRIFFITKTDFFQCNYLQSD